MRSQGKVIGLVGLCLVVVLVAILGSSSASATFPGKDGSLISEAVTDGVDGGLVSSLLTIDPVSGTTQDLISDPDNFLSNPRYSPDGDTIAFMRHPQLGRETFIWVANADGSDERRIDREVGEYVLDFSPDGSKILFEPKNLASLMVMNIDGSDPRTIVASADVTGRGRALIGSAAWSPTGKWIAYDLISGGPPIRSKRSIYIVHPSGSGQRPLPSLSGAYGPDWAPDGKTITYARERGPVLTLKLKADQPERVVGRGSFPVYSPSGEKLLYACHEDVDLCTVPVAGGKSTMIPVSRMAEVNSEYVDWQSLP